MKKGVLGSLLAVFAAVLAGAEGAAPSPVTAQPTTPATTVRSDVPTVTPLPPPGDGGSSSEGHEEAKSKGSGHPPEIILRDKSDSLTPERHGAGMAESGKITVKARGSKLTATLTGAAYAHCYAGRHSEGLLKVRLVQEFEVTPPDDSGALVGLRMSGKLDGYVRSEANGSACLRSVDAAVYPACGGIPVLSLVFPPRCAPPDGAGRCQQEVELPPQTLPAGRYVLVADLTPEASVDGTCRGHAEAVFAPGPRVGTWYPLPNAMSQLDGKGFGLAITLKVQPLPFRAE